MTATTACSEAPSSGDDLAYFAAHAKRSFRLRRVLEGEPAPPGCTHTIVAQRGPGVLERQPVTSAERGEALDAIPEGVDVVHLAIWMLCCRGGVFTLDEVEALATEWEFVADNTGTQ